MNFDRWHVPTIRRTNWRQQCSTCGVKMTPRTWTYCSKACEMGRQSFGDPELPDDVLESILDAQIAIESAGRAEAKKLKAQMKIRVQEAYREASQERGSTRRAMPVIDPINESSEEFWRIVLGDQSRRYRAGRANFGRDFLKFCTIGLEAHTFHGVDPQSVVDTRGVTVQDMADIYESGALRKLSKLLPRTEHSIIALLEMSDDALSQALSEGILGPHSTETEILSHARSF